MVKPVQMLALFCMLALTLPGVSAECDNEYSALQGALDNYRVCTSAPCVAKPRTCVDIQALGYTTSGVYDVYYLAGSVETPVSVYCDMDTAGGPWLVFQRRQDGTEDFYRNWANYTDGFGDLQNEFWLGNKYLNKLTCGGPFTLRVDLEDFEGGTRHAEYTAFGVGDPSSKYTLSVSGYSGDAGDALAIHNGMKFTTKDQDNDRNGGNCAITYQGAWWYIGCHYSNLNGQYLGGSTAIYGKGINWHQWKGYYYSLKFTEMKFKP